MTPRQLKLLGAALLALVGALAALQRFQGRRAAAETLWKGDPNSISKLVLESASGRVALARKESRWWVQEPLDFPADATALDELVSKLPKARLSPVLSSRPEKHPLFEVDASSAVRLTVYDGKPEPSLDVRIGKSGTRFDSVYVRFEGRDEVREAAGLSRYQLERKPKEWLDRTLVSVKSDDIEALAVSSSSGTLRFERRDDGWHLVSPPSKASTDTIKAKLEPVLAALVRLDADEALLPEEFPKKPVFDKPAYKVTVRLKGGKETTLIAGAKDDLSRHYVRREGDDKVLFAMYPWRLKPFQKSPQDFR